VATEDKECRKKTKLKESKMKLRLKGKEGKEGWEKEDDD